MKILLTILIASALTASAGENEKDSPVSVVVTEVLKNEKSYTFNIVVENKSAHFAPIYIMSPDRIGGVIFETKINDQIIRSTPPQMPHVTRYRGLIMHKGDKLQFACKAAVIDGGLNFETHETQLMLYDKKPKIRVWLNLYVSNFKTGKAFVCYPESDWVEIEYNHNVAKRDE